MGVVMTELLSLVEHLALSGAVLNHPPLTPSLSGLTISVFLFQKLRLRKELEYPKCHH